MSEETADRLDNPTRLGLLLGVCNRQLNSLRPSIQIVERVAHAKRVSPEKLAPLYDTIDVDALDALFQLETDSDAGTGHVQFQYEGHTIVAASDGRIELADHDT